GQNGERVEITRKRERELLTTLAVHQGTRLSRDLLVARIWDRDDFQAKKALNTTLWRLRAALNEAGTEADHWLDTGSDYMRLRKVRGPWVDVSAFQEAVGQPLQANALEPLQHAIELYRGELAPGLDTEWLQDERRSLQEHYQRLLSQALDLLMAARRYDDAETYAGRLLRADPYEEQAWRTMMLVKIETGQRAQAIRTYQDMETLLSDDLGIAPSPESQALYRICREPEPTYRIESVAMSPPHPADLHARLVGLQGQLAAVMSALSSITDELKNQ
ncbi:MAG: BTAD domain-containing putative transcriptional regulator, partial [Pseudomonadota bacterium]